MGEPWNIEEQDETEDVSPPWPNDWDVSLDLLHTNIHKAVTDIKKSGNFYYYRRNYPEADRKYRKALRYINWWLSKAVHADDQQAKNLLITMLINLSAVKLQLNEFIEVVNLCSEVSSKLKKNMFVHDLVFILNTIFFF